MGPSVSRDPVDLWFWRKCDRITSWEYFLRVFSWFSAKFVMKDSSCASTTPPLWNGAHRKDFPSPQSVTAQIPKPPTTKKISVSLVGEDGKCRRKEFWDGDGEDFSSFWRWFSDSLEDLEWNWMVVGLHGAQGVHSVVLLGHSCHGDSGKP